MDTVTCRVIGPHPVAGAVTGQTVDLDPDEVNIDLLVTAGCVEVIPVPPAAAKPKRGAESAGDGG